MTTQPARQARSFFLRWEWLLAALILCGLLLFKLYMRYAGEDGGTAQIGGPFELVDQDGRAVTEADFKGKFLLVYFGYTYCPDACPTALGVMAAAIGKLDVAGERVTPMRPRAGTR